MKALCFQTGQHWIWIQLWYRMNDNGPGQNWANEMERELVICTLLCLLARSVVPGGSPPFMLRARSVWESESIFIYLACLALGILGPCDLVGFPWVSLCVDKVDANCTFSQSLASMDAIVKRAVVNGFCGPDRWVGELSQASGNCFNLTMLAMQANSIPLFECVSLTGKGNVNCETWSMQNHRTQDWLLINQVSACVGLARLEPDTIPRRRRKRTN